MLSFFPRDVLDRILDLTESVSEGFPPYCTHKRVNVLLIRTPAEKGSKKKEEEEEEKEEDCQKKKEKKVELGPVYSFILINKS